MHTTLITIHIGAGLLAILSGFAGLVPRKGTKWHLTFGNVFFYAMIVMTVTAAVLATFFSMEPINGWIGLFTLYLVLTARQTARNRNGKLKLTQKASTLLAGVIFLAFLLLSLQAYQSGESVITGIYVEAFYVYTVFAALALLLDIRVWVIGGITGKSRVARHIWRMTLALFIATGSLFLGQPQVFPEMIRASGVLGLPVLLVVMALLYWLVRVFIGKRFAMTR